MRVRSWAVPLGLLVVAAVLVASRPRAAPSPAAPPVASARGERAARGATREPSVDPDAIRDVFRFADEPGGAVREAAPRPTPAAAEPAPAAAGPRLVGLVRRQGALLAAFAIADDVVLAGAGQPAGGLTVLEIGEDFVRVRFADGREERLAVP